MNYFFPTTKIFLEGQTELSSLTWATVASLWTMRANVAGYASVMRETTGRPPTRSQLRARFMEGIEYTASVQVKGVDLDDFFVRRSWKDDLDVLARFTLTTAIALYEGWIDGSLRQSLGATDKEVTQIQFPTKRGKTGPIGGSEWVLDRYASKQSTLLSGMFRKGLATRNGNMPANLDAMMTSFRGFKSVRNCWIHKGGFADAQCVADVGNARALKPTDLGMIVPLPEPIAKPGDPVGTSLYAVIGFLKLLRRIVITQESALAISKPAENVLLERWKEANPRRRQVSSRVIRTNFYRNELVGRLRFPSVDKVGELHNRLLAENLVFVG